MVRGYESFKEYIDPSERNTEFVDRDLFGKIEVSNEDPIREEMEKYRSTLRSQFEKIRDSKLDPVQRETLYERGYHLVEKLEEKQQNKHESEVLSDLAERVSEGYEGRDRAQRKFKAFSLVGTPMQEVLGFTGVVKIVGKGKTQYIPFEHAAGSTMDIAPVHMPRVPDKELEPQKYNEILSKTGHKVFMEARRRTLQEEGRKKLSRW